MPSPEATLLGAGSTELIQLWEDHVGLEDQLLEVMRLQKEGVELAIIIQTIDCAAVKASLFRASLQAYRNSLITPNGPS